MKVKNKIFVFALILSLISTVGTVVAADDITFVQSELETVSDENGMKLNENDDFANNSNDFSSLKNNDVVIEIHNVHELTETDEDEDEDDDGEELDDDEDDDWDDDEDEEELDDDDIDEYFESFNTTDEYLKFVKYLIKEKGFRFNNHLEDEDGDDGYSLYSTCAVSEKLYDGRTMDMPRGYEYFIPLNQRTGHVLDTYYPDIIYERFNQYSVDELYLGWLKWKENYHLLGMSGDMGKIYSNESLNDLPDSYDLRNVGGQKYVTPVKDQKNTSNCWAFASIAALESYLLKSEGVSYDFSDLHISDYDFSENNLKNVMSSIGELGANYAVNEGSRLSVPLAYFIRWSGPILESQDRYINNDVIEDYKALKHVQGVKYISPRKNHADNGKIKQAIYDYGGVVTSIYWNNSYFYENGKNYYYFNNPPKNAVWHSICIVGWDDTYDKKNFIYQSEDMENGAFIVKNSYGPDIGDEGYYYVSYHDTTLARSSEYEMCGAAGFAFTSVENNTNFGKNYHYTPLGVTLWHNSNSSQAAYANKWKASCNETLTACGVYVLGEVNCRVYVFVDNKLVDSSTKRQLNYPGFHTIDFDNPVNITKGQTYMIAIELMSNSRNISYPIEIPDSIYHKATANADESYHYNYANRTWQYYPQNLNLNYALHVYAEYRDLIPTKIQANDLSMVYGENKKIEATLFDENNSRLKNFELTFIFDEDTHVVTTNNEGQASITINNDYNPGIYKVSIHFFGDQKYDDVRKTITLNIKHAQNNNQHIIPKKNVNIHLEDIKCGNSLTFSLTSNGKPLKDKKIDYRIGSNTYKNKKLDKKGKFTIKKKLTKSPAKITVKFKGDNNYNAITKYAYIYQQIKISGLKKKVKYDDKIKLSLNVEKVTVYLKVSNKVYKIKFKKGKATFKVGKYNFKKGKQYNLKFYSKNKLYRLEKNYKLTILK